MADEIRQAILGARRAQIEGIQKGISNAEEVLAPEDEMHKGDDIEDPERFLKATEENDDDIEKEKKGKGDNNDGDDDEDVEEGKEDGMKKSDVAEALSHGDLKIKKTGKEIKEQITNVLLPDLTSRLATKEADATKLLEECGNAPTQDPECWWTDGIKMDCGYKVYRWSETYVPDTSNRINMPTFTAEDEATKKGNVPADKAQADARERYNEVVRAICNIKVDIKTCEVMSANMKDSETYELSARQAIVLRF